MKGENRRIVSAGMGNRMEKWIFCCVLLLIMCYLFFLNDANKDSYVVTNPQSPLSNMVHVPIFDIMGGEPVQLLQDDYRIIDFIWSNKLLEPPSGTAYNLRNPKENPSTGQGQFIQKVFKNKTDGFFIESGAFDGEIFSNTLFLEMHLGWKGLLIEGAPNNYAQLTKKNRKAWISKTCLSVKPYPHRVRFEERGVLGKISAKSGPVVQCVPLFSLLTAINVTTVDYFSLDVEGSELQVLKTIPFDRVMIKTLSVEFAHTIEGKDPLLKFMVAQGFKMVLEHRHDPRGPTTDFMFVHNTVLDTLNLLF